MTGESNVSLRGYPCLLTAFDPFKNNVSSKNTATILQLLKEMGRYDLVFYFVTRRLANIKRGIYWNYVFSGSLKDNPCLLGLYKLTGQIGKVPKTFL